jgi:hypothetical protein
MRHLFALLLLLAALGAVRLVGCGEPFECRTDRDCDDQNECTDDFCSALTCSYQPHRGADCDDGDDNECTRGRCNNMGVCTTGTGWAFWEHDKPCESDGIPGVCLCGECVAEPECSTNADCDDGNECTDETCDDCGSCHRDTVSSECDSCDRNGERGVCIQGVCREPECSTNADCDDGIACTDDVCDDCYSCRNPVNCDDHNPCTRDVCDRGTGECSYPAGHDFRDCGPCKSWEPDPSPECWITFCPPICTEYHHCENGECV